jgi:hypothetical protein
MWPVFESGSLRLGRSKRDEHVSGQGISSPLVAIEDFSPTPKAVGSPGWSSGVPIASLVLVMPPPIGYASVGSSFSSQLAASSWVSSPVSPDSIGGASGLAGSLSKPGEVFALTDPALSTQVPPLLSPEMLSQGLSSLAPALDVVCDSSRVLSSSQQASSAVVPSQAKVPQAWKAGCGLAFPGDSSRAAKLGEQLHLLLPVMSESGAPIYPLESRSVMRYSRKQKDAHLNKFLIAESLTAIIASPPLGPHHSPPLDSVAVRETLVSFCRHGFLLPRSPSSPPLEVGESSR